MNEFIISRILEGRAILFLGAGATYGSLNRQNSSPPLGRELASILAAKCKIEQEDADLGEICAVARRRLGDADFFNILRSHFQFCTPSESLRHLMSFYWKRIYSVNIDDATEKAIRDSDSFEVELFTGRLPVREVSKDGKTVQLVKLNGSVDRLEEGIVFSPDEYIDKQVDRAKWYEECAHDYLQNTFIFLGTQLNEPAFWWHVRRLAQLSSGNAGESFILLPTIPEVKREFLATKNVTFVPATGAQFSDYLRTKIGSTLSFATITRRRSPALHRLLDSITAEVINTCGDEIYGVRVIDRASLENSTPRTTPGARSFYTGSEPTWRDILDEVPARLAVLDDLSQCIFHGKDRRILLKGPAGSGKTTTLMQCALTIADNSPDILVLWIENRAPFPLKLLDSILHSKDVSLRLAIFVDNASQHTDALNAFLNTHTSNPRLLAIICSDRSHVTSRKLERLVAFEKVISARQINAEDASKILEKLERFAAWGVLRKLTQQERMKALLDRAGKQLLVGLREATSGIGYDRIIADEYRRVEGKDAKTELVLVSLATMHHLPISVSTLDGAMRRLGCVLPVPVDQGVEDIALLDETSSVIRLRHAIIADFIVMKTVDRSEGVRCVKALLKSLARLDIRTRSRSRGPEAKLYTALVNHENVWRLTSNEHESGLGIYRYIEEDFETDALFWLHYALFEQKCGKRYLDHAINHIRHAMGLYPESYEISNAYANIHFYAAEVANSAPDALVLMDGATDVMEKQTRDPNTEPYAIVGLVTGRLKVLSRWYPERCERERLSLLNRLKTASKRYPSNREIERALREAPLIGKAPKRPGKTPKHVGKAPKRKS